MTQRERDRLVVLKKADKKLITQKQAAQQLGLSERQIRRLLAKLRREGDQAVIHATRGRPSNCKISAKVEKQAVAVLSQPEYAGFGPAGGAGSASSRQRRRSGGRATVGQPSRAGLARESPGGYAGTRRRESWRGPRRSTRPTPAAAAAPLPRRGWPQVCAQHGPASQDRSHRCRHAGPLRTPAGSAPGSSLGT